MMGPRKEQEGEGAKGKLSPGHGRKPLQSEEIIEKGLMSFQASVELLKMKTSLGNNNKEEITVSNKRRKEPTAVTVTPSGPRHHRCSACGKRFSSTSRYLAHMKLHLAALKYSKFLEKLPVLEKDEIYRCGSCFYSTRRGSLLELHRRSHSRSEEEGHICDVCDSSFRHREVLSRHLKLHFNQENKMRIPSPEFFSSSEAQSSPEQTSSSEDTDEDWEERPRKRSSGRRTGNKPKQQAVPSEKLFTCTVCKGSFTDAELLRQHQEGHENVKSLKCSVCPFWSDNPSTILTHEKHCHQITPAPTEDDNFECTVCGYRTDNSYNLIRHMKNHTVVQKFQCSHCQFWSNSKPAIGAHEKKYHTPGHGS